MFKKNSGSVTGMVIDGTDYFLWTFFSDGKYLVVLSNFENKKNTTFVPTPYHRGHTSKPKLTLFGTVQRVYSLSITVGTLVKQSSPCFVLFNISILSLHVCQNWRLWENKDGRGKDNSTLSTQHIPVYDLIPPQLDSKKDTLTMLRWIHWWSCHLATVL